MIAMGPTLTVYFECKHIRKVYSPRSFLNRASSSAILAASNALALSRSNNFVISSAVNPETFVWLSIFCPPDVIASPVKAESWIPTHKSSKGHCQRVHSPPV